MNKSIKRRQTLLSNWLQSIGCKLDTKADSGSCYLKWDSPYTSQSKIRISDHNSQDGYNYINVILSPLNTTVVINCRNFCWNGSYAQSKNIIYTLIMSKLTLVQNNTVVAAPEEPLEPVTKTTRICFSKSMYKKLDENQKTYLKKTLGFSGSKSVPKTIDYSLWKTVEERSFLNGNTTISKKYVLEHFSPTLQKEILSWINANCKTTYKSLTETKTNTFTLTEVQFKKIKPYL